MNKLPLVLVTWSDAWVDGNTPVTLTDVQTSHKPTTIRTIGWLLLDDDVGVSLANEYYDDSYRGRTFILRSMVISVEKHNLSKVGIKRAARKKRSDPSVGELLCGEESGKSAD